MKNKIINAIKSISILLDIVAEFIVDTTLFLLLIGGMCLLTIIAFMFNKILGIVVLVICLAFMRTM